MKSKISNSKSKKTKTDYELCTLKNGIRILVMEDSHVRSGYVLLLFGAGSRYETKTNNGISHFLEHMFFKGTNKRQTAREISSILDGIGASFNAFTGKDHTGYYIKSSARHLELSIELLSDMLLNSKFDKKEIEKEKGVIVEEMRMYRDTPQRQVAENFEKLLYGDVPLGWEIGGPEKVINSMDRKMFVEYLNQRYKPNNMIFVVAGNVKTPEVARLAEKYFGQMQAGEFEKAIEVVEHQDKPQINLQYKKTDQAHLVIGVRGYHADHKDKYVISVISTILGGMMSSRLFEEVREKRGLAYYVGSDVTTYHDVGYLDVSVGSRVSEVEETIKVVLGEFWKLKTRYVGENELKKIIDFVEGKLALESDVTSSVAARYGTSLLLQGQITSLDEILVNYQKVTVKDILRVSKDIFNDGRLNMSIIGPYKDQSKLAKLLQIKRYTTKKKTKASKLSKGKK